MRAGALASPILPVLLVAAACASPPEPADLVLLSGRIVTLEQAAPEVPALAARDGRIVALGDDDEVGLLVAEGTRVIDLSGRLAIPGFIEAHGHFTGLGRSLTRLDLGGARSWEEVVERVAAAAAAREPGEWIVGWGWHQEKWDASPADGVEGYPTHHLLSRAVAEQPVMLKHAAGNHGGLVNLEAMRRIGIDDHTPDPPGGTIVRDTAGRATGLLREKAYAMALDTHAAETARRRAEQIEADARREIELADRECLSHGVTSFQDAGSDLETIERLRSFASAGELGVRLWVMLEESNDVLRERLGELRIENAADHHLTVRAIKRYIDGALGTHGAWLLEPYDDLQTTSGLNTTPLGDLRRSAELAAEHGFQLAVHAIGDRGNRETLDIYEEIIGPRVDGRELRWRIEHAQHLDPSDVSRFAELGIIASMQPVHCTSDGPWVPLRLGDERSEQGAYVWRRLLEAGTIVVNGTDTPIEDIDPIANFHAAVTRRMSGGEAFHPDQRMSRTEALRAATIDAAYAAFEEDLKGSLAMGKLADVTVLSQDILEIDEARIPETEVLYTIVGGRVLYERAPPGGSS